MRPSSQQGGIVNRADGPADTATRIAVRRRFCGLVIGKHTNQVRTAIFFLQASSKETEADYSQYLNTYVLARLPKDFLDNASQNGIVFTVDQETSRLRRAKVGFQNIALIVYRDLSVERRFYRWLLFAPSDDKKWQAFSMI